MRRGLSIGLVLFFVSSLACAQSTDTPAADSQTPESQPASPQTQPQAQNESQQQAALDEESDESNESEDSLSRFIPTEQISQDLGVSFPADI